MEDISKRLEVYIESKNLTAAQVSVKPSWTKSIKPTPNPTNPIRRRSAKDSRSWKNSCVASLWKITTPSSTSAAVYVVLMNEKPLSMEYSTGHT